MKSADFYPQAFSPNDGEVILTDDVLSLSGTLQENMAPYYLGYVDFENMPTLWKMHTISIDSNTIVVSDIEENYGWGFDYHWNDMDGSGIAVMRPCFIIESNGAKTDLYGGYSHHFVNSAIIASASFSNAYRLCFTYIAMPTSWIKDDDSSIGSKWAGHYNELQTYLVETTYEQLYEFLENNGTFTLTNLRYDTRGNTITLSKNDFGEDTHTAKMVSAETPGYTVFIQITNLYAYGQQAYMQRNNTKSASRFTPFFAMSIKGNDAEVADQKAMVCPNHLCQESGAFLNVYFDGVQSEAQQILSVSVESSNKIKAGNTYMGNFKVLNGLTQQDFRERGRQDRDYYWYTDGGVIQGKILVEGTNQLFCRVACPLEIEDIRRIICFTNNKNEIAVTSSSASLANFTGSQGYTTDYTTALFDKDTSNPLEQRVSANFVDIADSLCLWQYPYTDMAVNRFTEDDIPEYTPPGPEPGDEDQSDGSDWLPNTSFAVDSIDGFATMYGLKGQQLGRFGQYLWAAFWSDDFLNSIGVIFNENLSLNPSEILNYIISVRCYPFSLSGRAGASSIPDTIYIGRGGEGIALNSGSDILKLTSYTEDIDGGLSVWEGGNTIPAYYGDFRDCESCSRVTVFVPFCGSLELPPSQVVGNKIHLRYCVDFSSGAIQATVSIEGKHNYIAGTLTGTIGATVELSASNLSQVVQKLGGLAGSAAKSIALLAIGSKASATAETGEELVTATDLMTKGGESAVSTLTSVADMGVVPAASFGSTAGFSSFQVTTPMIRVEYRYYELPSNYAHVYGYACNKTVTLSTLEGKGYTVCNNVDLSGIPATQDELSAIESLLTSGVYF